MSAEREIWGWAWADGGVRSLYVRAGDGEAWRPAELESPRGYEWQRFSIRWTPERRGATTTFASLAEAEGGLLQPASRRRNAIHEVQVTVA